LRAIGWHDRRLRCFARDKYEGSLLDVDTTSGEDVVVVDGLAPFTHVRLHPDGSMLGVVAPPAVGTVPAELTFFSDAATVLGQVSVPDATSGIAAGAGRWYVGCRQGDLHAFDLTGGELWRWTTPGAHSFRPMAKPSHYRNYLRPCPWFVEAGGSLIATSSMNTVYALDADGRCMWDADASSSFVLPVSSLAVSPDDVVFVGSAGTVLVLDSSGSIRVRHALGHRPVFVSTGPSGELAATLCAGMLWCFSNEQISARARIGPWTRAILALEHCVVAWGRQRVEVVSRRGELIGSATFPRPISSLQASEEMIVAGSGGTLCAIGFSAR
jgi:hypothetical protein